MSFKGRIIIYYEGEVSVFSMPDLTGKEVEQRPGEEVKRPIEEIEREAYERGFEAGEKAGLAMGEEKARVILEKIENLLRELLTLRQRTLEEIKSEIIELATSLARKIILREIKTEPEIIVNMTKEAITRIERTGPVTIKLNPSLYNFFMRLRPELLSIHDDLVFDVDPSLSAQGTLVIGPQEEVSTDIDEQLRNIIRELGEKIGSTQP